MANAEVPEDDDEVHKKDVSNKLQLIKICKHGKTEAKVVIYKDEKESKMTSENEENSETCEIAYVCDIHKATARIMKSKEEKENPLDDKRNEKSIFSNQQKNSDCVGRSSSVQLQTCFLPTLRVGKR